MKILKFLGIQPKYVMKIITIFRLTLSINGPYKIFFASFECKIFGTKPFGIHCEPFIN